MLTQLEKTENIPKRINDIQQELQVRNLRFKMYFHFFIYIFFFFSKLQSRKN